MANLAASHPYQRIDGLQEIYYETNTPSATFVFETAEKADLCREAILQEAKLARAFTSDACPDRSLFLVEVLAANNLSRTTNDRTLSYSAKTMGTVGRPIQGVDDLLHRLGSAMSMRSPSKEIRAVTLHQVNP